MKKQWKNIKKAMSSYNKVFTDKQKLKEMLELRKQGFSVLFLGKMYNVDHSSITYHCLKNRIIIDKELRKQRLKEQFTGIPFKRVKIKETKNLNYIDLWLIEEQKKQKRIENCKHEKWFKKCSCCGKIIESEKSCIIGEVNI